ncbi:MAG: hypothetical protein HY897_19580 [Deltaproteobacteria bacterium]|nr:hypothetical protein [Deltaproteobacteria bacterium]
MYENRAGRDAKLFADSPVHGDWFGQYSAKVDDGVYVYIPAARELVVRFNDVVSTILAPKLFGFCLILVAFGLVVARRVRAGRQFRVGRTLLAMLAGIIGFGAVSIFHSTCYAMSSPFSRRTPEMVQEQRELLEKFRNRGVIGEQAYRTAIEAIEDPLALRRFKDGKAKPVPADEQE